MPVTRANLKISRDYHNRVALVKYPYFTTLIIGIVVAVCMIAYGATQGNDYIAFSSVPVLCLFGAIAISIDKVKERPHKHLQRLIIEAHARKELDFARHSPK